MEIQNTRSGQSLIEAIIAISLLTVGFIGIAALLSQSLFLTRVVSDQTTATYLAAEGIELAKNLIDHDVILHTQGLLESNGDPSGWAACFSNSTVSPLGVGATKEYELDYASTNCDNAFFNGGNFLQFDPVTGLYSYKPPISDNAIPTKFTRDIIVSRSNDPGGVQLTVTSRVSWGTGAFTSQHIDLEDHFYNWRNQ